MLAFRLLCSRLFSLQLFQALPLGPQFLGQPFGLGLFSLQGFQSALLRQFPLGSRLLHPRLLGAQPRQPLLFRRQPFSLHLLYFRLLGFHLLFKPGAFLAHGFEQRLLSHKLLPARLFPLRALFLQLSRLSLRLLFAPFQRLPIRRGQEWTQCAQVRWCGNRRLDHRRVTGWAGIHRAGWLEPNSAHREAFQIESTQHGDGHQHQPTPYQQVRRPSAPRPQSLFRPIAVGE